MTAQPPIRKLKKSYALVPLPLLALLFSSISLLIEPSGLVCGYVTWVTATCILLNMALGLKSWGKTVDLGWLVFNVTVFFWYIQPSITRTLTNTEWYERAAFISAGPSDFLIAFFITNLFYTLFCFGYMIGIPKSIINIIESRIVPETPFRAHQNLTTLILLFLAALSFYVIASGGITDAIRFFTSGRSGASPWDSTGNYGTALSPFHVFAGSLRIALSIIFGYIFLLCPLTRRSRYLAGAMWIIAALSVAIESGTRTNLILSFGPPLLLYLRHSHFSGRLSQFKALAFIFIVAMVLAFFGSFLRTFRNAGNVNEALQASELVIEDNDGLIHTAF